MFLQLLQRLSLMMSSLRGDSPELACRRFQMHLQQLQTDFQERASISGKPRGLKWAKCDWLNQQQLVRDRSSGMLTMLAGINIHFEAIPGGEMEDVEAVSTVRDACAVFHYHQGRWGTGGRALFNMHPEAAAVRLADSWERVILAHERPGGDH